MWIDLRGNIVFTPAQLLRRKKFFIQSMYRESKSEEDNARDLALAENAYAKAVADNALLEKVIAYEQATLRLARYLLSEGRQAVAEIPEVIDPDTGTITQEFVPGIPGIDPLPSTIKQNIYNSEGVLTGTTDVPNPLIAEDDAQRVAAQGIIDKATLTITNQVDERSA